MIIAASTALAESISREEQEARCLMPEVSRLWDVCGRVGNAVACQAVRDGVCPEQGDADLDAAIQHYRWTPAYPEMIES